MKKVLQIDGGGILGIMPLAVLVEIERVTGQPCYKQFDLMSGTSTGSIICGTLAAGVPASVLYDLYVNHGKTLFTKTPWYNVETKYDRTNLLKTIYSMIQQYGRGSTMGDVRTDFISAAFNRCSGRTHFQMSWDAYHKTLDLAQVIAWSSLSAVHYFGPIAAPNYAYDADFQVDVPYRTQGAVWYDGGQGRNNCTINECITTCFLQGYLQEPTIDGYGATDDVYLLSLGCGATKLARSYDECVKDNEITEIKDVISEARDEGVYDQLSKAYALASRLKNLHVSRMDVVIQESENVLDALDKIPNFVAYGEKLKTQIPDIFKKVG